MGAAADKRAERVVGGLDHPLDWEAQQRRRKAERQRSEEELKRDEEKRKRERDVHQQQVAERARREAFDAANRHKAERAFYQDCQQRQRVTSRLRDRIKAIERRLPYLHTALHDPERAHQARQLDIERCNLKKRINNEEASLNRLIQDKEAFIRRYLNELWKQRDA
jgi:hypothetical protein